MDDIRKRAFRIMDSGYLDGGCCSAGWLHRKEGGRAQRKGGRELCTIAHVMKLRLVAELAARKKEGGSSEHRGLQNEILCHPFNMNHAHLGMGILI